MPGATLNLLRLSESREAIVCCGSRVCKRRQDNPRLRCRDGNLEYEVDLERCATPAEALDWIAQVAVKSWATDTITLIPKP
jgi:hypothetical protein